MKIGSRWFLVLAALTALVALAGCSSNGGDTTKPADIQEAIKGKPIPADKMAQVMAASQAQAAAQEAKAKAASKPGGPPPPGSH